MARYDELGAGYDAVRRADPYIVQRLIHHLRPRPEGVYLDLACGTGNYTMALAQAGLKMHGLDQSRRMIESARAKSGAIDWSVGDAEALPYGDRSFSGAICTLAIHHFPALLPAFQEVYRVLNHGRFLLFTSTPEQMARYWLHAYFPAMMKRSCEKMPSEEQVVEALLQAGFRSVRTEPYSVREDLQDFFLYSGKHRPAFYLDPRVRAGSSSFRSLADPEEVQSGCDRLAADLQSGRIAEVMAGYQHEQGDYLFVVAEKEQP